MLVDPHDKLRIVSNQVIRLGYSFIYGFAWGGYGLIRKFSHFRAQKKNLETFFWKQSQIKKIMLYDIFTITNFHQLNLHKFLSSSSSIWEFSDLIPKPFFYKRIELIHQKICKKKHPMVMRRGKIMKWYFLLVIWKVSFFLAFYS